MALTTCKDCKESISNSAKKCPHCGCPVNELTAGPKVLGVLLSIGLAVWAVSLLRHHEYIWAGVVGGLSIGFLKSLGK
jgi:hypothetical protein